MNAIPQTFEDAATSEPKAAPAGLRPMRREDLPGIGRLFNKAFRGLDQEADAELVGYIEKIFLDNPNFNEADGTFLHQNKAGNVDSALLGLPLPFVALDRKINVRLLCAFMADGRSGAAGAARVARAVPLSHPDLCFTDNASPVSADHWVAAKGFMLPIQSLDWRRRFRPFRTGLARVAKTMPKLATSGLVASLLAPLDRAARRRMPSFVPARPKSLTTSNGNFAQFFENAERMTARFAIRPDWTSEVYTWISVIALANKTLGELTCKLVLTSSGEVVGCYLYYGKPGGTATVMNLLSVEGREFDVTAQMFADLDDEGYAAAEGMSQPFLMNALMRQRQLTFKHRGYCCMITHYPEIRAAAEANDIYVGGIASERWSKLLTDF